MSETVVATTPRRPRTALWVAIALGVVLALLVVVLATRDSATSRLTKSPLVGKGAPATAGTSLLGGEWSIDDHRGEWVLVNFFATWCVPCQQEHDDLVRFSAAHDDASVVSVVFSDEASQVRRFFERRGGDWPVLRDDDGELATAWGVARVPESYLVAPNGLVVAKITGGVEYDFLEQQLARLQGRA